MQRRRLYLLGDDITVQKLYLQSKLRIIRVIIDELTAFRVNLTRTKPRRIRVILAQNLHTSVFPGLGAQHGFRPNTMHCLSSAILRASRHSAGCNMFVECLWNPL